LTYTALGATFTDTQSGEIVMLIPQTTARGLVMPLVAIALAFSPLVTGVCAFILLVYFAIWFVVIPGVIGRERANAREIQRVLTYSVLSFVIFLTLRCYL